MSLTGKVIRECRQRRRLYIIILERTCSRSSSESPDSDGNTDNVVNLGHKKGKEKALAGKYRKRDQLTLDREFPQWSPRTSR